MTAHMDQQGQPLATRNRRIIADMVAAADPERWLAVSYAARNGRAGLAGLFAFDISLGRLVASTNEPMIGAMRIAWWREALERLHLPPVPAEPVLQSLAEEVAHGDPDKGADLARLADGWLTLIEAENMDAAALEAYAENRGARLFSLAADLLGVEGDRETLRNLGKGWALIDLAARLSRQKERLEAVAMASGMLDGAPWPVMRGAKPLIALAALARHDAHSGLENRKVGSPVRQLRMLRVLLFGR
jgi:phytoene synthase